MSRFTSILRRLASSQDKALLDQNPPLRTKLRVVGRIGLRFWWAYLVILFMLSLGTVSAGMDMYHRTESPQFCGACHEMGHNFDSWGESRHKAITCADCHAQTGALGWVKTKTAGLRQLKVHFTAASFGAIRMEENQRGTVDANCRRCHAGVARMGERLGLGVSHRQHLERGMDCIACHTGAFTHPKRPTLDGGVAPEPEEKSAPAQKEPSEAEFVEVAQCFECHDGQQKLTGVVAFDAKDETRCLKCHPDADHALAHGARTRDKERAERKPCLDCHEGGEGKAHFEMGKPGKMCVKCHERQEFANRHSPYKKGDCEECHRVMSPAYLFKTGPRPTNGQCLECHPDTQKLLETAKPTLKMLGGFTEGTEDLHRGHRVELQEQQGDGWCLACHAAHGSDFEVGLLAYRQEPDFLKPGVIELREEGGGTCRGGCHSRKEKSWSGPPETR